MQISAIKALTCDVFGTVTDWRSTVIREGQAFGQQHGINIDWNLFADAWRARYVPSMDRVRSGKLPWMTIDAIHRMILDELLRQYHITDLSDADIDHLNRVWHRLDLWPDVRVGLERLRGRFLVATLSNGNIALLTNLAKHADLRWDCILSAELSQHYKPDPEVYLTAASLLGLRPEQIMMVAAHNPDLRAAKAVGFSTAFVARPGEHGPSQSTNLHPDPSVDVAATDFNDLADQLLGMES
jgi:2-haloacid dehalogenase